MKRNEVMYFWQGCLNNVIVIIVVMITVIIAI